MTTLYFFHGKDTTKKSTEQTYRLCKYCATFQIFI